MAALLSQKNWQDIFYTSRDGLRLYARHYPAPADPRARHRRPMLCLPGLTRNCRDFHDLATFMTDPANPSARDVFAVDYRGRGRSAPAPDWQSYTLQQELADVLDLMTLAGLHDVGLVGTSRGGLLAMLMATTRPAAVGAVVLNDIGPVVEREGLLRIVAYIGRVPLPPTWAEAGQLVRDLNKRQFPAVPEHHWDDIARQLFNEEHGVPVHGYDQALAKAIGVPEGAIPALWPQFDALARVPMLTIRGELSDILSEATVNEMRLHHPSLESVTVRGQGHAPLLRDRPTMIAVADFLMRNDQAAGQVRIAHAYA